MIKYLFSFFLFLPLVLNAGAKSDLKLGNKAYAKERYGTAYEYYQKAAADGEEKALYNSAAALYRLKDYGAASQDYLQTAEYYQDKDIRLTQNSYYNAANAQYMNKQTKEALASLKKAILLNSKDEAAIHNMQFMLSKQKQDDKNQQNKEGEKDSPQDKQDNSQEQNQQGSNQDQQNQDRQDKQEQDQQDQDKLSQQEAKDILKMLGEGEKKNNPPPLQGNLGEDKNSQTQVENDW